MKKPSIPLDEVKRVEALRSYGVLDTEEESIYDQLTELASEICGTRISLISLIDERRQWFKAHYGLTVRETPKDLAFCAHAVYEKKVLIVEDSRLDERFHDNPLVTGEPRVIFYAGVPLIDKDGYALGTLCVIDSEPKKLSAKQIKFLEMLGQQVILNLRLRRELMAKRSQVFEVERLFAQVPGAVYQFQMHPDGRSCFPFSSQGIYEIYEVTPEQVQSDASLVFSRLYHEDFELISNTIAESAKNLTNWQLEYRVELPKQGLRWLRGFARPERMADGSTLWHGFISDITLKKITEENFYRESKLKNLVIEGANYAIVSSLPNGVITMFNGAAERMLGYSRHELIGIKTPEILHDPDEVAERAIQLTRELKRNIQPGFSVFTAKVEHETSDTNEWTYIRKDGSRVPVRLCVTAMRDSSDKIIGYLGVAEDVSEQKRMAAVIESQRLQMLNNSKLASLGEMAGGLAHEINNPLAIISGKVRVLQRKLASENLDKVDFGNELQKIWGTAIRIDKIVRGLMSFSRNSDSDTFVVVKLREVVDDTMEFCSERFKNNGIDLRIDVKDNLYLKCRPTQISQVLLNLLNNAFDAALDCKDGWVSLEAEISSGHILIKVTDCGSGISPEVADKIMMPFFTTKEVGKGTGLGLSISRGIIAVHGGEIRYDSMAKNTCFVIQIPAENY